VKVVDDPKVAQAVMQFTEETRQKEILSLTGTGRVREFQLRYRVGFRVHDGKGAEYVPQSLIVLTRDVTFNDTEILAKEQEEALLFRDMQTDMVQQIIRRLAAAKPPKPAAE
jgi:LPS-assembly lipoprotein